MTDMLISDLKYLFSTNPENRNQELRECMERLGIYKELIQCRDGRYFVSYLCQSVKTKILAENFQGKIILFDRKRVERWILRGKMPKITLDSKGRVMRQLLPPK